MTIGRLPFAAALIGLLLGAAPLARGQSEAPVVEPDPPPAAFAEPEPPRALEPIWVHRKRPVFIAAGAVTFAASYILAIQMALMTAGSGAAEPCSDCGSKAGTLLIPVAGPWLAYRHEDGIWPAVWSGAEAAGAIALLVGLAGHDVLEWRPRDWGRTIAVVPVLTGQQQALSLNLRW